MNYFGLNRPVVLSWQSAHAIEVFDSMELGQQIRGLNERGGIIQERIPSALPDGGEREETAAAA